MFKNKELLDSVESANQEIGVLKQKLQESNREAEELRHIVETSSRTISDLNEKLGEIDRVVDEVLGIDLQKILPTGYASPFSVRTMELFKVAVKPRIKSLISGLSYQLIMKEDAQEFFKQVPGYKLSCTPSEQVKDFKSAIEFSLTEIKSFVTEQKS